MQGPQKDGKRLAEYFKHERHYESPRLLVCPIAVSENSQVGTSQDRSSSYVIHSFLSSNCCPDLATRNSCCPPDNVCPFRFRINSFQKIEVLFKRMKNLPSSSTRQRHYYRRCFWLGTIRTWGGGASCAFGIRHCTPPPPANVHRFPFSLLIDFFPSLDSNVHKMVTAWLLSASRVSWS
jgi:hypothetical protein